jgi:hypothetical protein
MSETALHLKLDRLLARQDQVLSRMTEQDETIAILTGAMTTLNDSIGTQTEVINRLAEALSGIRQQRFPRGAQVDCNQPEADQGRRGQDACDARPPGAICCTGCTRCGVHGDGRRCRYPARGTDMSGPRTPGWIYVLASQSHPGIVKIGRTSRHTPGRMIEVDRSAYAAFGPWTEVWSRAVADYMSRRRRTGCWQTGGAAVETARASEADVEKPHAKIGQLLVERDFGESLRPMSSSGGGR